MSKYQIQFHPAAKKELDKLDYSIKVYIIKSLDNFINSFSNDYENELIKMKKIKKLKGKWSGFYRLRLRNYRVIYEKIDNKLIIYIIRIAHRREVY